MLTGGDGLFVLAFSSGEVFLLLGDGAAKMMSAGWIDFIELAGDLLGFIDAAADYAGGLAIEIAEVGQGLAFLGLRRTASSNSARVRLARENAFKNEAWRLSDEGATKPQVEIGVLGLELDGLFAFGGGGVHCSRVRRTRQTRLWPEGVRKV